MVVIDNKIYYKDHVVICDPSVIVPGDNYVEMMSEELSIDGDVREHARELRSMNNDGSWGIKKL